MLFFLQSRWRMRTAAPAAEPARCLREAGTRRQRRVGGRHSISWEQLVPCFKPVVPTSSARMVSRDRLHGAPERQCFMLRSPHWLKAAASLPHRPCRGAAV